MIIGYLKSYWFSIRCCVQKAKHTQIQREKTKHTYKDFRDKCCGVLIELCLETLVWLTRDEMSWKKENYGERVFLSEVTKEIMYFLSREWNEITQFLSRTNHRVITSICFNSTFLFPLFISMVMMFEVFDGSAMEKLKLIAIIEEKIDEIYLHNFLFLQRQKYNNYCININ